MSKEVKSFNAFLIGTMVVGDPVPVAQASFCDDEVKAIHRFHGVITVVGPAHVDARVETKRGKVKV